MPRFTKKPVTIEAHRWFKNGDHPSVQPYPATDALPRDMCRCGARVLDHGWIDTLEGGHVACPGDWIITGVKGEKYPCKPDIFEETYTPTEDVIG